MNLEAAGTSAGEQRSLAHQATERLLASLAVEVAELDGIAEGGVGIRVSPLHELRFDVLVTDAPTRPVPPNGLGSVEADLNSLTDYREGRRWLTGTNIALEGEHSVQFPSGISLQARPRALWHDGRSSGATGLSGELLSGSLRAVRGNLALTVGREYTEWALAEGAGLFFSANARSSSGVWPSPLYSTGSDSSGRLFAFPHRRNRRLRLPFRTQVRIR